MTNRTKIALLTASSVVSILAFGETAQADSNCIYSTLTNSVYCSGTSITPATNIVALGTNAVVQGSNGVAIGAQANVTAGATNGVAVGTSSSAEGLASTAVGASAKATKLDSSAFGTGAQATGQSSTALGAGSLASQLNTVALGGGAQAIGNGAMSLGYSSYASALNSMAIGYNAESLFQYSTAIGYNAATNRANQIMLGGAGSLVSIGDITASTTAQNAATANVMTVDANGIVGRSNVSLQQLLSGFGGGGATFDPTYLEDGISQINIDLGYFDDRITALESAGSGSGAAYDDSAILAKNAQQDTRLTAVEDKNAAQDTKIASVEDKNVEQDETLGNHDARITTLEDTFGGQQQAISQQMQSMQTTLSDHSTAINNLQGQVDTLFDLANHNRKAAREANAGVALALAMDTPVVMPGEIVAVSGGFGYWNGKVGGSASLSYRVGARSALSAGVGIASTGKVGGRIGFRMGW